MTVNINVAEQIDQALLDLKSVLINNGFSSDVIKKSEDYCIQANEKIMSHIPEIQEVCDMWNDDISKLQYINYVKYSFLSKFNDQIAMALNKNLPVDKYKYALEHIGELAKKNGLELPKYVVSPTVEQFVFEQYIYKPYVDLGKGDVFIDCGAFLGDSAMWAAQKGAEVHALEAISYIYKGLVFCLDMNRYHDIKCYNYGVSSENGEQIFKASRDYLGGAFLHLGGNQGKVKELENAKLDHTLEDTPVQCVRLDDFLKEHSIKPTFIKMDIEGAELGALHGTAETIKELKPKLAICLYHEDEDLWTIPKYIKSLVPDYKIYCRQNSYKFEFVLYATVENKQ